MRHSSFSDFLNKKKRDDSKQLEILEKILRSKGLKTENFLESHEDPYIFCYAPSKNCSFDGIRIYKIADTIAFRIQKESETHPYGKAYPLDVEEMFEDFLSDDHINRKEAAIKVMEEIAAGIRRFFDKSAEAEKEDKYGVIDDADNVALRSQANDYSTMIYNKGN